MNSLEAISAKVHEQWMESKRKLGVTTRKSESGEELMVPYEQLSEAAKELDRGSVRAVLAAQTALATAPPPEAKPISAWIEQQQQTTPREQPFVKVHYGKPPKADQPQAASDGARSELEQEYGKDHPWHHFDYWHKDFHEHAPGGPIDWPCRQPLRCFWRWTRKTGVTLNQNGIAEPLASHDQKVREAVLKEAALLVEKAFEQSWVVQDTLDAIRSLAGAVEK